MLLLLLCFKTFAMHYPLSHLNGKHMSYESDWGFKINAIENKNWLRFLADASDPYHLITYKKIGGEAELNIRVDPVSQRNKGAKVNLQSYTEHWLKQYPKLGLEVLEKDYKAFNGQKAVRVDAYNMQSKKQIRQYVIWRNNNAIILSCSDQKDSFAKTIYPCENILRSINWL